MIEDIFSFFSTWIPEFINAIPTVIVYFPLALILLVYEIMFSLQFLVAFGLLFFMYFIFFIKNTYSSKPDDSVVDMLWPINAIVYGTVFFLFSSPIYVHFVLFFALSLWGYRLFFNIYDKKRNSKGVEDRRYVELKSHFSKKYYNLERFGKIYMLQMVLALFLLLPVMIFMQTTQFYTEIQDLIFRLGIFILGAGLFIETLSDLQLKDFIRHKDKKKKKFCDEGLWAYSRHPNYFGESLFWLGIAVVLFTETMFGFLSWMLITFLLTKVSGIPMAERSFKNDPEYKKYQKQVSPFIIWFRKN